MIVNNLYISIATVDRSAGLMKMELPITPEIKDAIVNLPGGAFPVKSAQSGAVAYEINCEWDYSVALFYQLQDLMLTGAAFTVVAAENGATPSPTNRVWTGSAVISGGLTPTGAVGDRKKLAVKFVNGANAAWTFATS